MASVDMSLYMHSACLNTGVCGYVSSHAQRVSKQRRAHPRSSKMREPSADLPFSKNILEHADGERRQDLSEAFT